MWWGGCEVVPDSGDCSQTKLSFCLIHGRFSPVFFVLFALVLVLILSYNVECALCCRNFAGRNGQPAARWLKKVKNELQVRAGINEMSPNKILRAVEFLLTEEAEDWVETHREARHLLSLNEQSQKDVEISATLEKTSRGAKRSSRKGFIAEFQQETEETVSMYYTGVQIRWLKLTSKIIRYALKMRSSAS